MSNLAHYLIPFSDGFKRNDYNEQIIFFKQRYDYIYVKEQKEYIY